MAQPGESNILVVLTVGDSLLWPGLEVEELLFNGESAEIESDAGMLEDAIAQFFKPTEAGCYFLFGFKANYSKDYWGEVDVDYELAGWRKSTPDDEKQFYEFTP